MTGAPETRGAALRWTERALLLAVCVIVGWFYTWTVRSSGDPWEFGEEQRDYYNLLIDGWLDGQLHLKVDVPDALLQLPDPYDPRLRPPGLGLHDASFYEGKYYLYFGAGPVVSLMLPFRALTGTDLPQAVAVLAFAYSAFLASVALWLALRRRYFPASGAWVMVACVLTLGLAGLGPMLLRRPQVWELPIAAACCFAMLALLCIWRALHAETARRRLGWFAGAGLGLGLAIASRPTYLVASPLLAVPLWFWWRADSRAPWREAASAAVPLACVGTLMALHNYLRFGHPLQFGQAYQFSLDYESKVEHFALRYVPFNGWRYFFSAAEWSRYFPFIQPAEVPAKPPGFGGHDDVYGVMANLPLAWLALAAPLALRGRSALERGRLAAWLGAAGVLFAAMALLLLCFFGSIARYMLEFTPALMLLATVGVLAVERIVRACDAPAPRALARLAWGGLTAVSIVFGVLVSLQLNGLLPERNPALQRDVARRLNEVPAAVERLFGWQPGALELDVTLPVVRKQGTETLLSIGENPAPDRIFVRYLDGARVQIGLSRPAMPEVVSAPIAWEGARPRRLRVALGAFLPPTAHPWFSATAADDARLLARMVRLELDGGTIVQAYRRFDRVAGKRVRVGAASLGSPESPRFSGEVSARRVDVAAEEMLRALPPGTVRAAAGVFKVQLRLPRARPGTIEPLVVTGATGQGDALGVEYLDGGRVRFLFDHWGSALLRSEPLTLDAGALHDVTVDFPWLAAVSGGVEHGGELRVAVDGAPVWAQPTMGYRADPEEVAIGDNPIGGSHVGPRFTGEIVSVARLPRE